ncbi:uracil-DNA glycosylase [Uruburuella testudinis]|uniref:Uracil-DNA glycosylase n=1 Tax=Uruburuella testudinis TaxID=1282863 RepID=A0ABY4DYC5_9NEIS|nr:uracil-DNA glycosylase family protein [Uruburuella testudinis]UOO81666.1 uracil-DNA glycosylase [Uruburuella testudinis]
MLSSRYLHLHEALGLGPMWLNRSAKVLPAATAHSLPREMPAPAAAASASHAAAAAPVISEAAQNARLAAMAAVGGQTGNPVPVAKNPPPADNRPSEKTVSTPSRPTDNLERPSEKNTPAPNAPQMPSETQPDDWKQTLAGTINPAQLMVASICPAPEDNASGQLFSGSVGRLLDNMLAAIGLTPDDAHKTSWVKDAPAFSPNPAHEHITAELPRMSAELALSQAKAVLLLGQVFEKPEQADTIARLCGNTPYFIIPHPARLLRQPQLKAQAWATLKQLRQVLES